MSAGHVSREFRRAYGESPYSYLMTRRIERALALLRLNALPAQIWWIWAGTSAYPTPGRWLGNFREL